MDSLKLSTDKVKEVVTDRRFLGFAIGALILAVIAILQINNLNKNKPMCELFADCKIATGELQRLQIALSKSGLTEFKVEDNRLMVPVTNHSLYLQAASEQDVIPQDIRDSKESTPNINPFLSRSQQIAMERSEKKKQIREMVLRLPFVDQAWFEMDQSSSHSAFERSKQSAVVSIRTSQNVALSDQHVDTVQRMISGAVAGLDPDGIVVIDLSAGFAHQDLIDPSTTQQVRFQRIAFEQQRFYENRIQEILKNYPGIVVRVRVDVSELPEEDKLVLQQQRYNLAQMEAVRLANANRMAAEKAQQATAIPSLPDAGANGFASISQMPDNHPPQASVPLQPIMLASHSSEVPESLKKKISVSIDVPQKLVHDLFGSPVSSSLAGNQPLSSSSEDTQSKFNQLQSEIVYKVRQVLPESTFDDRKLFPIAVNMIRQPVANNSQWMAKTQEFVSQNWPSAAVLGIGLILLTIVTRKQETPPSVGDLNSTTDEFVSSIDQPNSGENTPETGNPEVRLSKLIEKDPDAAAKVIEAWIRDAA